MRLMLVCSSATTLPSVIVSAATMATITHRYALLAPVRPPKTKTRSSAAKPAAFEPTEKKSVDGVGAPS